MNNLTPFSKVTCPSVTISFLNHDGTQHTTQCVGGMYNYGGTVKSNRSAYVRKMYSQIKRGLLKLGPFVTAKLVIDDCLLQTDGTFKKSQYTEEFKVVY